MADENTELNTEVKEPEGQEPQLSPIEQRAMDQGWVPLDQWQGDPDDWRPAKEFVDRGELLKSISELRHENKRIKEGVDEFRKHHIKMREVEYNRALAALRAEKKAALEEGDADKVVTIDDQIAETREAHKAAQNEVVETPATPQVDPDLVRWEARNPWYRQDRAMKAVADEVARDLVNRGERNPSRIMEEVEKEVRKSFPHKFENPNRQRAAAVEGATKTGRTASKSEVHMTDAEKAVMNKILRSGIISKEDYLKEFKARQGG